MARKTGWFGEGRKHSLAALKGRRRKKPQAYTQSALGRKRDLAHKSKATRQPWQPAWRGDVKGSRL